MSGGGTRLDGCRPGWNERTDGRTACGICWVHAAGPGRRMVIDLTSVSVSRRRTVDVVVASHARHTSRPPPRAAILYNCPAALTVPQIDRPSCGPVATQLDAVNRLLRFNVPLDANRSPWRRFFPSRDLGRYRGSSPVD